MSNSENQKLKDIDNNINKILILLNVNKTRTNKILSRILFVIFGACVNNIFMFYVTNIDEYKKFILFIISIILFIVTMLLIFVLKAF